MMTEKQQRLFLVLGLSSAVITLAVSLALTRKPAQQSKPAAAVQIPPLKVRAFRAAPKTFPPDTNRPRGREILASGRNDPLSFSPETDIVRFEDSRVWWESDQDRDNDTEDDHLVHACMVVPLKRLIDRVSQENARLKVQDTYRPKGRKHTRGSLHIEGRAIDLTAGNMSLERLAKLCWVVGFDWVYHEAHSKGGAHVHCSVRRDHQDRPSAAMTSSTE